MIFTLSIDCGNAAFDPNPGPELARLLRAIADRLDSVQQVRPVRDDRRRLEVFDYTDRHGGWIGHFQTVHDVNGNDVGRYAIKP